MKKVYLCAISNISSGNCSEDCAFCTQSAHNKADIQIYKQKEISTILQEVRMAVENYATGFCLVSAGKGLDDKKLEFVCSVASKIKKEFPSLNLIACNGTATLHQLKELKNSGISSYNHNLETSKEYYPSICTTHTWKERFETCLNIKEAGLKLCSGGIFGLGETHEDRESFIKSLKELSPHSMPVNFFHPNDALPLPKKILDPNEALNIVKMCATSLPNTRIMVAGGREITLKERWIEIFKMGASAIVIGNYLTTKGNIAQKDIEEIKKNGYQIALQCD